MNRWNIPGLLEREVIKRDRCCVYCGVEFTAQSGSRRALPSWEHIINDARIITRDNIARCCVGCNASKGTKSLIEWLESEYCRTRGITGESVAAVARQVLSRIPGVFEQAPNKRILTKRGLCLVGWPILACRRRATFIE